MTENESHDCGWFWRKREYNNKPWKENTGHLPVTFLLKNKALC